MIILLQLYLIIILYLSNFSQFLDTPLSTCSESDTAFLLFFLGGGGGGVTILSLIITASSTCEYSVLIFLLSVM